MFVYRKHCAICKCPRDVHDVTHKESVNVHDRLGLNKEGEEEHHRHHHQQHPQLPVSSSRVMPLNKGARPTSSDVYSWIPAGLVPDQVKICFKLLFVLFLKIFICGRGESVGRSGFINPDTLDVVVAFFYIYIDGWCHTCKFFFLYFMERVANETWDRDAARYAFYCRNRLVVNPSLQPSISPLAGAS